MKLDDPAAVPVLTDLVKQAQERVRWLALRMDELRPAHDEYEKLRAEADTVNYGKVSAGGLRLQLSIALLYREIGTGHIQPHQIAEITFP